MASATQSAIKRLRRPFGRVVGPGAWRARGTPGAPRGVSSCLRSICELQSLGSPHSMVMSPLFGRVMEILFSALSFGLDSVCSSGGEGRGTPARMVRCPPASPRLTQGSLTTSTPEPGAPSPARPLRCATDMRQQRPSTGLGSVNGCLIDYDHRCGVAERSGRTLAATAAGALWDRAVHVRGDKVLPTWRR